MKRFFSMCLLVAALLLPSKMTAQWRFGSISSSSSAEEINKYFSDNLMYYGLDPIEGMYSVEETRCHYDNGLQFDDDVVFYRMPIVRRGDGYYTNLEDEPTLKIRRIGDTNGYNCETLVQSPNGPIWVSKGFSLQNSSQTINYSIDVPASDDKDGSWVTIRFYFVKEYPTTTVYGNAAERAGSGSGFALNNGYLCTNYHVAGWAKSIKVYGVQGDFTTSYSASVVAADSANDLVILKIDDDNFPGFGSIPYSVKPTLDEVGEEVFALGYPHSNYLGYEVKLSNGVISAKSGFKEDKKTYQLSIPGERQGNSGGPVFDSNGDLIGVYTSHYTDAENVSYAVKSLFLQNLVYSSLSEDILPKENTISSLSFTEKVSALKDFVYYIAVSSREDSSKMAEINSSTFYEDEKSGNLNVYIDVNRPFVKSSPDGVTIKRVRVTDKLTIVDMVCDRATGNFASCNISPRTFISCNGVGDYIIKADGIPMSPEYYHFTESDGKLSFTLYFPAISKDATEFDIIEPEGNKPFSFYGIRLGSNEEQTDAGEDSKSKEETIVLYNAENPQVDTSPREVTIKKVTVTDTQTIVELEYDNSFNANWQKGFGIDISPYTYIVTDTGLKRYLNSAEGITIEPKKHKISSQDEKLSFTLYFPAVPESTAQISIIEPSGWKFYGIKLENKQ